MKTWFLKVIEIILNRSLFWKVGFIIGLCVVINFILTIYFYSETANILSKTGKPHAYIFFYERAFYLLIILIFVFLILGAMIFWFFVKRPLDKIGKVLDDLIFNPESIEAEKLIRISAKDEIGVVAERVNRLLKTFRELQIYKHLIENDESVEDIYERLGEVIKSLTFGSFVIYEVSNSQNTMRPVYKSDE